MWATKTILVGDDGSSRARVAVEWARVLTAATDAELMVVRVVKAGDDRAEADAIAEDLERRVGKPARDQGLACTCLVVMGEPRQALVDEIMSLDVDLAVVGDTGHWLALRPPLGSVAAYLTHHSPRPVAVVPARGGPLEGGRMVVGIDGSEGSGAALAWAAATAAKVNGSVTAVSLYDPLADSYPHPPQASEWHHSLEPEVRAVVDSVHEPDVEIVLRFLGAHRVEGLLEVAGELNASLIAVGARGGGGFHRLLLGGTATELLHHSDRPVVVVPSGRRAGTAD